MKDQLGQTLIEILIVIALMALLIPVLSMGLIASREGRPQQIRRSQALQTVQEYHDAIVSIRENGWDAIAVNGTYHPITDGTSWSLFTGPLDENGIISQVVITDVLRDGNGVIAESGSIDPSTKYVTITSSWNTPIPGAVTSSFYVTRYLDNATYTQTTEADFNTGTLTDVIVTNNSGGEVTLGSGGAGAWCAPELTIGALDLPKSGVANAVTAIEGKAFIVTGDNASGVAFAEISISNANPPVATIDGTFDGYKTNDVFGESDYAYIATDNNSKEIVIITISSGTPSEEGYFNASGSTDANAVFVSGSVGYMTQGSTLRTFDLSSKSGSRLQLGSITLAGTGKSLQVVGSYVYVAVDNSSNELQIVNASDPSNLSIIGSANLNSSGVSDVIVNDTGTRAYVSAGASSASQPEVFIVDVSTKIGSRPVIGSADTESMSPNGITIVPGNRMIVVGSGGEEYQVFDISTETAPIYCGGLEVNSGINGVSSVLESDGDAYSYIITGDTSAEFRMIEGGPGGTYSSSGIYESSPFDVGYSTAFNRIIPTYVAPVNTSVQFQVAVADAISGSCAGVTYAFTGPDGTNSTYYTNDDDIVFNNDDVGYENPARCFRYRVYLSTSDSSATPLMEELSINYSP